MQRYLAIDRFSFEKSVVASLDGIYVTTDWICSKVQAAS